MDLTIVVGPEALLDRVPHPTPAIALGVALTALAATAVTSAALHDPAAARDSRNINLVVVHKCLSYLELRPEKVSAADVSGLGVKSLVAQTD